VTPYMMGYRRRQFLFRVSFWAFFMLLSLSLVSGAPSFAQTKVKPGFNLFSPDQDVEIGQQSAVEVERQMPLVKDPAAVKYLNDVGRRLTAVAPGAKYPYQFRLVNVSDINAFALPGGFMFVNRGLIEAASGEGELAGVMAHEISHVALRHGTNQASKASLAQAGLGVLGGAMGGSGLTQVIGAIGGFGLNAVFLKFSRKAEEQADIVGTQILAKAGYDPMYMARFFEKLRKELGRDPSKMEQFFSDHPAPADRAARVKREIVLLRSTQRSQPVGAFEELKATLHRLPPAPSGQQLAQRQSPQETRAGRPGEISLDPPSSRFREFRQSRDLFRIEYPENWKTVQSENGYGVTIVPNGGVVDSGNNQTSIICGAIVNNYEPFEGTGGSTTRKGPVRGRTTLEQATNDLVNQITQANSYLQLVKGSQKKETIEGARVLSVVLSGSSPVTGKEERVTVFTQSLSDGDVIYSLFIAPGQQYELLATSFDRMIRSLRINHEVLH
jgi:Peptidase family M48